jgi:uncharacterized membrane protein
MSRSDARDAALFVAGVLLFAATYYAVGDAMYGGRYFGAFIWPVLFLADVLILVLTAVKWSIAFASAAFIGCLCLTALNAALSNAK